MRTALIAVFAALTFTCSAVAAPKPATPFDAVLGKGTTLAYKMDSLPSGGRMLVVLQGHVDPWSCAGKHKLRYAQLTIVSKDGKDVTTYTGCWNGNPTETYVSFGGVSSEVEDPITLYIPKTEFTTTKAFRGW